MKKTKIVSFLIVLAMMLVWVAPASAQLGSSADESVFTIQNVTTGTAQVTVQFISETGIIYTPTQLDAGGTVPNPFNLIAGASKTIIVKDIPIAMLPANRYSVIISSTAQVVAVATIYGTGTAQFTGSYNSFSTGSTTFYMPGFYHNFNLKWWSLLSIQNLGSGPANYTINIQCDNGLTGTMSASNVPQYASRTFDLMTQRPATWSLSTQCQGSAVITSNQPVVATDSYRIPAGGNTLSIIGASTGSNTVFIPALYSMYNNWRSALNIRKLEPGNTTVTVTFSDGAPSISQLLTDAIPYWFPYMPVVHSQGVFFSATVTTNPAKQLAAVVHTTRDTLSLAINGLGSAVGTSQISAPVLFKFFNQWRSDLVCQNVGSINTRFTITYENGYSYTKPASNVAPGGQTNFYTPAESDANIPMGWFGDAKVVATDAGAKIACVVNMTNERWLNPATYPGDWSASYNAPNQ